MIDFGFDLLESDELIQIAERVFEGILGFLDLGSCLLFFLFCTFVIFPGHLPNGFVGRSFAACFLYGRTAIAQIREQLFLYAFEVLQFGSLGLSVCFGNHVPKPNHGRLQFYRFGFQRFVGSKRLHKALPILRLRVRDKFLESRPQGIPD